MIAPADLAVIVGLNLVGAAAPGPDVILVTRTATRSRPHAWATTCGIQLGVLWWCSLTVFGAAALLTAMPRALQVVQVIGGAYLVWMGINAARQGWRDRRTPPLSSRRQSRGLAACARALFGGCPPTWRTQRLLWRSPP